MDKVSAFHLASGTPSDPSLEGPTKVCRSRHAHLSCAQGIYVDAQDAASQPEDLSEAQPNWDSVLTMYSAQNVAEAGTYPSALTKLLSCVYFWCSPCYVSLIVHAQEGNLARHPARIIHSS